MRRRDPGLKACHSTQRANLYAYVNQLVETLRTVNPLESSASGIQDGDYLTLEDP